MTHYDVINDKNALINFEETKSQIRDIFAKLEKAATGKVRADKNGEDFVIGRRSFENYEQLPRFELKPDQPVEFNENFTDITGPNGEPLLHTKKPFFMLVSKFQFISR